MGTDSWGRVDEHGTVYVRTADGERVVGSWQAGSPDAALAYFRRKYDGLVVEVDLLERRVRETELAPKDALSAIERLREQVSTANAVGDLMALAARLTALAELVDSRREERRAARAAAAEQARSAKEAIVDEAERLALSDEWRHAGERLRALVDEWKRLQRLDRRTDDELWHRFSQARSSFTKRRKAHFAALDAQRDEARQRKEVLAAEAEALAGSTDWAATAARFRELMRDWKAAGRAQREAEDELWNRFRGAQDAFFAARSAALAERDSEFRGNLEAKEALLAEAEKAFPVTDVRSARSMLRTLHDDWERIGPVPRDARQRVEGRLHSLERAVREAEEAEWQRTNPEARARAEATVRQLRSSIEKLEKQAADARSRGDERKATEADTAAAARREWLAEAERTLGEFSG